MVLEVEVRFDTLFTMVFVVGVHFVTLFTVVLEVMVHFDMLFVIHFEVWGAISGGILQRAKGTLGGP